MREPVATPRVIARRSEWLVVREPPAARAGRRLGIRYRLENTAADRIAVCSLEKKLSRRP
jgi:hypothetical protein